MKRTRRRFSPEFKREAVRMVLSGEHSLAHVARDLDLRRDMLRRWKRQFEDDPVAGGIPPGGRPQIRQ